MGRQTLLLLFIGLLSVAAAGADSYSCRDNQGVLYFADSPARLPDECQGQSLEVKPDKLDNLNIVPATPVPQGVTPEIEQSIRATETERQQQQQKILKLQKRAEQLAANYQEALKVKRRALRSWSYTSREEINKAELQMSQAKEDKLLLLQELDALKMSSEDRQKIKQDLDVIGDE